MTANITGRLLRKMRLHIIQGYYFFARNVGILKRKEYE